VVDDHEEVEHNDDLTCCRSVNDAPSRQSSSIHPSSEAYLSETKAGYPVSLSRWALDSTGANSQEENAYSGTTI
jgi:hypothetical protein